MLVLHQKNPLKHGSESGKEPARAHPSRARRAIDKHIAANRAIEAEVRAPLHQIHVQKESSMSDPHYAARTLI